MLRLFQSIFGAGREAVTGHPAELIDRTINRALDGTDLRLHAGDVARISDADAFAATARSGAPWPQAARGAR